MPITVGPSFLVRKWENKARHGLEHLQFSTLNTWYRFSVSVFEPVFSWVLFNYNSCSVSSNCGILREFGERLLDNA